MIKKTKGKTNSNSVYFFKTHHQKELNSLNSEKLYLADRLIEEIDKAFKEDKPDLSKIKSAIFDIVVLEKVLKVLGFNTDLTGKLRQIRNSIAHIDERMSNFDFQPISIEKTEMKYEKEEDNKLKLSISLNFQGAVVSASVGANSTKAVSLYGMVNNNFLWVDDKGKQRSTSVEVISKNYKSLLASLK